MALDTVTKRLSAGHWRISPLTLRIMAVNMAAIVTLALGVLYTSQYERELIDSELAALSNEGRLYAAALAEGGVRENLSGGATLAPDLSRRMVRKLIEGRDVRTMLFNRSGKLIADSHQMLSPGGMVQIVSLPPPKDMQGVEQKFSHALDRFLRVLPTRIHLPAYPEPLTGMVATYPHALDTLAGGNYSDVWRERDGDILLTASVPVQRLKNVLGAVLITKSGEDIEEAVRAVQMTVLRIFLLAFAVTVFLSAYLSATISRPIVRLAHGVRLVQSGNGTFSAIPDLSMRKDEIGMLSMALRDMTQALSDRMAAIENFAADVAHEIKNPLASVRSAIEVFGKIKDPVRQAQLSAIIHDDIQRMDRLISDISAASRLDAELARLDRQRFDIVRLVREVIAAEKERGQENINLRLDIPQGEEIIVLGHPGQMGQVIYNILSNAASFTPLSRPIEVTLEKHNGQAVIHIENQGPPIPERNLERVFERFYTQRPETEEFGKHSGLGLSISRQIVRAHKGDIFAQNINNADGSHRAVRFVIALPVAEG